MTLTNFCWGFVGGLIFQIHIFLSTTDLSNLISSTMNKTVDSIDSDNIKPINEEYEIIKNLLSPLKIGYILFYAVFGGIMSHLINPQITFFALYVGLTSYSFLSKYKL